MGYDALGRYTATHKAWDHVGNILPGIEHSEGIRPAFPFKPAAWLPVQVRDKYYEDWYVIMPGKLVALDPDGRVMPAQYGLLSSSSHVVYTSDDVTAGTIDIATGEPVTAAKTVDLDNLTGVRHGSWTKANAGTSGYTAGFMGRFGIDVHMGAGGGARYPIGVAPYGYLQWCGGDGSNPADFNQHNYNRQHQATVLCDGVIRMPLVPGKVASETVDKVLTGSTLVIGTQACHNRTHTRANSRYNSSTGYVRVAATDTVVALALDNFPVAKNTVNTPLTLASNNTNDDLSGVLLFEKSDTGSINAAGDFFVDYDAGVIFVYSVDGASLPSAISGAAGTVSINYYHFATAGGTVAGSSVSRFACAISTTSELTPGDFMGCGTDSNWVRLAPGTGAEATMVGQVLGFEVHPQGLLEYVRTAYDPAIGTTAAGTMTAGALNSTGGLGKLDQMPGSATAGYPDAIHYSGASNLMVIINLIKR